MILVEIRNFECLIEDGIWSSENDRIQKTLNAEQLMFEEFYQEGSDPDPEFSSAVYMVNLLGGKITNLDNHKEPPFMNDVIY